jgi:hypothetical protein
MTSNTQSQDNRILTEAELNAITGGKGGTIETDKPGIATSMLFGDQKLTVFASADVHGLVWSPR